MSLHPNCLLHKKIELNFILSGCECILNQLIKHNFKIVHELSFRCADNTTLYKTVTRVVCLLYRQLQITAINHWLADGNVLAWIPQHTDNRRLYRRANSATFFCMLDKKNILLNEIGQNLKLYTILKLPKCWFFSYIWLVSSNWYLAVIKLIFILYK